MNTNNIELSLRVNGRPVAEYTKDGRHFVEGKVGSQYTLRIKNNNGWRAKVVVSVDGTSVITGQPAAGDPTETGYIIDAYGTLDVDGYRLDDNSVATFRFVTADQSYSTKENKMVGTTGVIGVRAYREKDKPRVIMGGTTIIYQDRYPGWWWNGWWNQPQWSWGTTCQAGGYSIGGVSSCGNINAVASYTCSTTNGQSNSDIGYTRGGLIGGESTFSANTVNQMSSQVNETPFGLGSSFGDKVDSRVTSVTFETGDLVAELSLYYAARAGLVALGVDLSNKDKIAFPEAFSGRYCKPPTNWVA